MEANLKSIRQSLTDIRHRWDKAKLKKSIVFWLAIGAIVLAVFLGFTRGGWMTESGASTMAQTAVVERLGLMKYWRTTRTRPDACAGNAPAAFCRMI